MMPKVAEGWFWSRPSARSGGHMPLRNWAGKWSGQYAKCRQARSRAHEWAAARNDKVLGFQGVNDAGLSVAVYREPDRLVIQNHAPMDLLNLHGLTGSAEPRHIDPDRHLLVPRLTQAIDDLRDWTPLFRATFLHL